MHDDPGVVDESVALDRREWRVSNWMVRVSCSCQLDQTYRDKSKPMIHGLIVAVHILVCFFIIVVVLLQSGKSGDISAAFGGQGSQTAFGPRGAASALSKATTWSAVLFLVTSITLSIYATGHSGPKSVLQGMQSQPVKTQTAPQAPTPAKPTQK